jgi:hypothetical protein
VFNDDGIIKSRGEEALWRCWAKSRRREAFSSHSFSPMNIFDFLGFADGVDWLAKRADAKILPALFPSHAPFKQESHLSSDSHPTSLLRFMNFFLPLAPSHKIHSTLAFITRHPLMRNHQHANDSKRTFQQPTPKTFS